MATETKSSTASVKADKARIDRLKEQLRSTPYEVDFERVRIMAEVYEDTAGDPQIIRRAKLLAAVLDRKKLYIDDNLFVGAMAGSVNAMYTYPGVERGLDEGREHRREVEDPGGPEGQRVGHRVLGETLHAPAGAGDLREALRLRSPPGLSGRPHRRFLQLARGRRQPELPQGLQRGPGQHPQGRQRAPDGPRDAAAEHLQALLLRGLPDRHEGHHPFLPPLCRAGPGDGGQGEGRHPQGRADRHCRDLRVGARASRPESAGGHAVPLPLPPVRRTRADRLRLLRSLPGPELRAVLPARQGRRARHL